MWCELNPWFCSDVDDENEPVQVWYPQSSRQRSHRCGKADAAVDKGERSSGEGCFFGLVDSEGLLCECHVSVTSLMRINSFECIFFFKPMADGRSTKDGFNGAVAQGWAHYHHDRELVAYLNAREPQSTWIRVDQRGPGGWRTERSMVRVFFLAIRRKRWMFKMFIHTRTRHLQRVTAHSRRYETPNLDWNAEFRNAEFRFSQLLYH